jgi:hypothetical protein
LLDATGLKRFNKFVPKSPAPVKSEAA